MNILILGNTAGLTNDFILKTFPNQAVLPRDRKSTRLNSNHRL